MPILNTSKDGTTRIYNVEVRLKTAVKVKENTELKGFDESDIIVNGSSFKKSIFSSQKSDGSVVVNFIRNKNYRSSKKDFLITTRHNSDSDLYDLYSVELPPKKVNLCLDNLYGKVITDLQKEIPDIKRGRYLSLNGIGLDEYITEERMAKLIHIKQMAKNDEEFEYLALANNLGDLKSTLDFINLFDFKVIDESIILESQVTDLMKLFNNTYTRESRNLNSYYNLAKSNKESYRKLSKLSKILYGKPASLIHKEEKGKIFVKTSDIIGKNNERKAA